MSTSNFDPQLMNVVPPSQTQGYDLWARDNAQAIAEQQQNIYRMQLSAAEMAQRQIEIAKLQQAAQLQQERYAHGWHDARSNYTPILASSTDPVYKPKLELPKIKPTYVFLFAGFALLCTALLIKLI